MTTGEDEPLRLDPPIGDQLSRAIIRSHMYGSTYSADHDVAERIIGEVLAFWQLGSLDYNLDSARGRNLVATMANLYNHAFDVGRFYAGEQSPEATDPQGDPCPTT